MEAGATVVEGFAGTDAGQTLFQVLKAHGLTLEDWAEKHPADKRFLKMAAIEESQRKEERRKEADRKAG